MKPIVARLWKLIRGPLRWRVLWFVQAKFMVGVTGVVRDEQGRVLLLKHRMWPVHRPWGLPTGYAVKTRSSPRPSSARYGRRPASTPSWGRLVQVTSGYKLRVEIAYEALHVGGTLKLDGFEILEARWFSPDALQGMQESHVQLIKGPAPH
jgi:hypothetical protein